MIRVFRYKAAKLHSHTVTQKLNLLYPNTIKQHFPEEHIPCTLSSILENKN